MKLGGMDKALALLVFMALFYITPAQDFLSYSLDQERIRCIGVRCPSDRPKCVIQNHMVKCIALPSSGNNNNNQNRLSRRPPPPSTSTSYPQQQRQQQRNSNDQFYDRTQAGNLGFSTPVSNIGLENINNNDVYSNNNNNNQVRITAPRRCLQRPEKGNCEAYFPRYFYNPASKRCESFVYGGCGGNANNFESLLDCFKACSLQQTNGNQNQNKINSNTNNIGVNNFNGNIPINDNAIVGNTLRPLLLDNNLFFSQPQNDIFSRPLNGITSGSSQGNGNERNTGIQSQSQQIQPNRGETSGFAPGAPPPPPRLCSLKAESGLCFAAIPLL